MRRILPTVLLAVLLAIFLFRAGPGVMQRFTPGQSGSEDALRTSAGSLAAPPNAGEALRAPSIKLQVPSAASARIRAGLLASEDWKEALRMMEAEPSLPRSERLFYRAVILDTCSYYEDPVKTGPPGNATGEALARFIEEKVADLPDPRSKDAVAYNLQRTVANVCRGFAGTPIRRADVEKAFAEAAAAGDPKAVARSVILRQMDRPSTPTGFPGPLPPEEAQGLVDVLLTGDPIAIRVAGSVLSTSGIHQSLRLGPEESDLGTLADATWTLAACRFGFECGSRNMYVSHFCAENGQCADDLAGALRQTLSPEDFARVERNAATIADAITRRDGSVFRLVDRPGQQRTMLTGPARITVR